MRNDDYYAGRHGPWIQTFTGRRMYFLDPRPGDIDIIDIAHALAHTCRYGGHCDRFYSVAEHSMLVAIEVGGEHALAGLLHDATEAYIVDLPRPLKQALTQIGGTHYEKIEDELWRCASSHFGLPFDLSQEVKEADFAMLGLERAELMPRAEEWDVPMPRIVKKLLRLSPYAAAVNFLCHYCSATDISEQATKAMIARYDSMYRARGWDGVTMPRSPEAA